MGAAPSFGTPTRREDHEVPGKEVTIDHVATVPVMVVDDQSPFRAVARTVVALAPGFGVVAEAVSGEEALEHAAAMHPAVVLMDINLPGIDGIEATRRLVAADPSVVVILLSTYDAGSLPADAQDCGATRYVHKEDFGPAVLREVWESAHPTLD